VLENWQDKPCIQVEPMVDKKTLVHKKDAFAHLILWISSSLSTAETAQFCKTRGFYQASEQREHSENLRSGQQ
jgi:hypothetical protein